MVGTVGVGDGDLPVFHGDGVVAALGRLYGEFLICAKGNGAKELAAGVKPPASVFLKS